MPNIANHCPYCGLSEQLVNTGSTSPENGGDLYVAEEMDCATEHYTDIHRWECDNCQQVWFMPV